MPAPKTTHNNPFSFLAGSSGEVLYQKCRSTALSFCRDRSNAEELAHLALIKLGEELCTGTVIDNHEAWLRTVIYHESIRQSKFGKKHVSADDARLVEHLSPKVEPVPFWKTDPKGAAEEFINYFRNQKSDPIELRYIFAQSVLEDKFSYDHKRRSKKLASELLNNKQTYSDQKVKQLLGSPVANSRQLNDFGEHFDRRNIDPQMFFSAIKDLDFLMWCKPLADVISDVIYRLLKSFQNLTKHHVINNILSASPERNNNLDEWLLRFTEYLDRLYTVAWLPTKYLIMGSALYFHNIRNPRERFNFEMLLDSNRTEAFFLEIATARHGNYSAGVERWLATSLFSRLYFDYDCSIDSSHRVNNLIQIERAADWGYHRTRSAIASAWLGAFNEPLDSAIVTEKFVRRLDPEHWYVGLALLPLCYVSYLMGQGKEAVRERLKNRELWTYLLMALHHHSLTTVLGSLVHLSHMPYCRPPADMRAEFVNALVLLRSSKSEAVQQWLGRISEGYWSLSR